MRDDAGDRIRSNGAPAERRDLRALIIRLGIARQIWVAEGPVEKHVHSIPGKLGLPDSADDHRQVLAVVVWWYLSSAGG